jgi:hypothetical protein
VFPIWTWCYWCFCCWGPGGSYIFKFIITSSIWMIVKSTVSRQIYLIFNITPFSYLHKFVFKLIISQSSVVTSMYSRIVLRFTLSVIFIHAQWTTSSLERYRPFVILNADVHYLLNIMHTLRYIHEMYDSKLNSLLPYEKTLNLLMHS